MNPADLAAAALVLSGAVLALAAAIGLHRLPDLYARMHAATKPATLGVTLCLLAAVLRTDGLGTHAKLGLAIAFQLITAPTAAHLLSRAAHRAATPMSRHTIVDDLAADSDRRPPPDAAGPTGS